MAPRNKKNKAPHCSDQREKMEWENLFCEEFKFPETVKKNINRLKSTEDAASKEFEFSKEYQEYLKYYSDPKFFKLDGAKNDFKIHRNEALDKEMMSNFKKRQSKREFKSIQSTRDVLPIFSQKLNILEGLEKHQIIIIKGDTGCGKTTQVPQYILDSYIESGKGSLCKIVCAQLKRISAVAVAERVCYERCVDPGDEVGYHVRLEKIPPRQQGSILYCTTGVLLMALRGNPNLLDYSHVIIDDVQQHEAMTDFFMISIREILKENKDLKLILMCATLNMKEFTDYFGNCCVIEVKVKHFPVKSYFLEDIIEAIHYPKQQIEFRNTDVRERTKKYKKQKAKFLKEIASQYSAPTIQTLTKWDESELDLNLIKELIVYLNNKKKEGAILVFLPGWREIETLHRFLTCFVENSQSKFYVIPLHSKTLSVNRSSIFGKIPGKRKIILSTNIAETSITIEDCTIVIDCGKANAASFDCSRNVHIIQPQWISKSSMLQRKGRAGRTQKGRCYHLFTRFQEEFLKENSIPEMKICNLESHILTVKLYKRYSAKEYLMKAMYPPEPETIETTLESLRNAGIITKDEMLTPLGFLLAQLPVSVNIGKLMVYGVIFSCLDPILSIAACSTFAEPFIMPAPHETKVFYKKKEELSRGLQSDQFLWTFVMRMWEITYKENPEDEKKCCRDNYLSYGIVNMLHKLKLQYCQYLKNMKLIDVPRPMLNSYNKNKDKRDLIKALICAAFYPNVGKVLPRDPKKKPPTILSYDETRSLRVQIKEDDENLNALIVPWSINSRVSHIKTGWLAFEKKEERGYTLRLQSTTAVNVASILLFGKKLTVERKNEDHFLVVDELLYIKVSNDNLGLILKLKTELDKLIANIISNPREVDWTIKTNEISILSCAIEFVN